MTKITQETLESSFDRIQIKDEAENDGIADISCEIIEIQPAEDPKIGIKPQNKKDDKKNGRQALRDIKNLFGDGPTEVVNQLIEVPNHQTIITIDDSDDDDCILVIFKCDLCPQKFLVEKGLNKHKRKHDWKFVCETCTKRLPTERKLMEHKRDTHENTKSHACSICDKKFYKLKAMEDHKRSHDRIFKCHLCNFECNGQKNFNVHRKIHWTLKIEPKTEPVNVKEEPKTELVDVKEEPIVLDEARVKEEPGIFLFGDVKIEMDS